MSPLQACIKKCTKECKNTKNRKISHLIESKKQNKHKMEEERWNNNREKRQRETKTRMNLQDHVIQVPIQRKKKKLKLTPILALHFLCNTCTLLKWSKYSLHNLKNGYNSSHLINLEFYTKNISPQIADPYP